eukprot:3806583-Rhodomonas_salina.2
MPATTASTTELDCTAGQLLGWYCKKPAAHSLTVYALSLLAHALAIYAFTPITLARSVCCLHQHTVLIACSHLLGVCEPALLDHLEKKHRIA